MKFEKRKGGGRRNVSCSQTPPNLTTADLQSNLDLHPQRDIEVSCPVESTSIEQSKLSTTFEHTLLVCKIAISYLQAPCYTQTLLIRQLVTKGLVSTVLQLNQGLFTEYTWTRLLQNGTQCSLLAPAWSRSIPFQPPRYVLQT